MQNRKLLRFEDDDCVIMYLSSEAMHFLQLDELIIL
jgi:hypothetical protein